MEPVKVGAIGYGYWGPNLLRNFNNVSGVQARWAADLDEKRREHIGNLYPDVTTTADGYVICLHDETLDRTTDDRGPATERLTMKLLFRRIRSDTQGLVSRLSPIAMRTVAWPPALRA